jgi:hypothetical protein
MSAQLNLCCAFKRRIFNPSVVLSSFIETIPNLTAVYSSMGRNHRQDHDVPVGEIVNTPYCHRNGTPHKER